MIEKNNKKDIINNDNLEDEEKNKEIKEVKENINNYRKQQQ